MLACAVSITGSAGTWTILRRDLPSQNEGGAAGASSSKGTTTP
jgi:hypothetical protein